MGDLYAGALRVSVRKMSATGILLDPVSSLKDNQFVYTTVSFDGGPSLALSGIVVASTEAGVYIQWIHSNKEESDKLDLTIRQYLEQIGKLPPEEKDPEPSREESLIIPDPPQKTGATENEIPWRHHIEGSRVYKLKPGQCTCVIGDLYAGAQRVPVHEISAMGVLIESMSPLQLDQFVYTSILFEEGPSLALSGIVVAINGAGTCIQWMHSDPQEAKNLDGSIRQYLEQSGELPPEPVKKLLPSQIKTTKIPVVKRSPPAGEATRKVSKKDSSGSIPEKDTDFIKMPLHLEVPLPKAAQPEKKEKPPKKAGSSHQKRQKGKQATRPKPTHPRSGGQKKKQPRETQPAKKVGKKSEDLILADGKVNLSATIRQRAKVVRSADLASQLEMVQVLNLETIKNLIKEAVDESVGLLEEKLNEGERKRLLEEAEETFKERLAVFQSEKKGLEDRSRFLQHQLERAQALLMEEREKVIHDNQFTVSDSGMAKLEKRLGRMLDQALKKGKVNDRLEMEMRLIVACLLDEERQKIREQAEAAQNDKISLLEKKVSRLANSLLSAESERDRARRLAKDLEAKGGMLLSSGNIYTAGLDEEDPNKERKLDLLKEIIRFNKEMRETLISQGRLPGERPQKVDQAEKDREDSSRPSREKAEKLSPEIAKSGESEEKVPVLATGDAADPDDMPWEPEETFQGDKKPKTVKIKRLDI